MARLVRRGGSFPFDFNALHRAPRVQHAVYSFWSKSKDSHVYIGKTDRPLSQRLREHWRGSDNPTLRVWIEHESCDLVVCYVECPARLVLKLERRLIRRLDPDGNRAHKT